MTARPIRPTRTTQNLLIWITGGLKNVGEDAFTMNKDQAVYQGAVWSAGCKIGVKASVSAPRICGTLGVKEVDTDDPSVNPWPASLVAPANGQLYPTPADDRINLMLGPELGG